MKYKTIIHQDDDFKIYVKHSTPNYYTVSMDADNRISITPNIPNLAEIIAEAKQKLTAINNLTAVTYTTVDYSIKIKKVK
jgi:hypothetical protein